jgi:hypothetical protein
MRKCIFSFEKWNAKTHNKFPSKVKEEIFVLMMCWSVSNNQGKGILFIFPLIIIMKICKRIAYGTLVCKSKINFEN